jgi:hypothetical protein
MLKVGLLFLSAGLLLAADAPAPETVMSSGSEIIAHTTWGTITVRAGERDKRTYRWGQCEGSLTMERRAERWHGSLGLYWPGTGFHWRECEGVARAVVEEGQQHFDTVAAALAWVKARGDWMPYVYRNDGLVVGWRTVVADRKQLNVDVWQLLIAGKKPAGLEGAADSAIATRGLR